MRLSSAPLNWTSVNCCHWEGITCDHYGWITRLSLPAKGLEGGMFPSSLGNLTHLTHLDFSHNSLYGSLETGFFLSLNRLEILDLSYNHLYGELPFSLPSSNIRMLDLSCNRFHGEISSSFFKDAWNLTSFNVSNNILTGSIPSAICPHSSPFIRVLDFSFNRFSGNIPLGLGKCSKLQIFRAGNNNLSGLLPSDIYNATTLQEISFPRNQLYGVISEGIGNLTNLQLLDLNTNGLSGTLPVNIDTISNLKNLETVDLSMNHLSGEIPASLAVLNFLSLLNVSYNRLEGPIPTSTQLQSFNPSVFEGNLKLCGAPLPNECQPVDGITTDDENNQDLDDDEDQSLWFGLSVVLGFFVGLLGFCCPLLLKRTWRYAYFQLLDNVQFMLYVKWGRLRRKSQGHVPNQKDEVKSSKPDSETECTNQSEYANSNSFMVPDNFQTTSLFNVPVKAPCPEDEEILMCTD